MHKSIILIISLFAICHSQEFDYSKMSKAEKILFYSEMKKSPVAAGFLEFFIPTAGYAYAGRWKKGLTVNLTSIIGSGMLAAILFFGIEVDSDVAMGTGLATAGIGHLYSTYDAINQSSKYNKRLKRQIFGKKKNKMKASLYPLQDGAGISLTYSFN